MIIYALACANNKYYVGRSTSVARIEDHFQGNGASWTKLHKPYKRLFSVQGDRYDEDKHVLRLMDQYGVDNVRGGSFSTLELTENDRTIIERLLRGATDRCFRCGEPGHFVRDCPTRTETATTPPEIQEMHTRDGHDEDIFDNIVDWCCCVEKNNNSYRRL